MQLKRGVCVELIEALKKAYADSDKMIVIAGKNMEMLWNNSEKLKGFSPDKLRLFDGSDPVLPIKKTLTLEYQGLFSESCAVEIQPLDGGEQGYLLRFFDCNDIELLSDRSGHLKFKTNIIGNIRSELSQIVFLLDSNRKKYVDKGDLDYLRIDSEARQHILRTFSATANLNELTKYYNGFYKTSLMNISVILNELCEDLIDRFRTDDYNFTYEIEPMIYLVTNADRLRAAVCNLLVNAFLYCRSKNKTIRLKASNENGTVIICIQNSGGKVRQYELERYKTPFEAFSGFGERESLGIAIASLYCRSLSGDLNFECKYGKYTKAIMQIPAYDAELPNEFRIERTLRIKSPYDMQYCILAKGLDLQK
jgi:hypothetical protein